MTDPTTDRITELLAAHRYWYQDIGPIHYICYCDTPQASFLSREGHEEHVASLLAVLVADAQTDAWEADAEWAGAIPLDGSCGSPGQNPYRKVSE